ncbi:GntR family transcriptional regulator [Pelagicoccus sp. SDUM812003]|uniref:GntR family transcriptional regulator n=1 Tax=Pelagicoccus sp. SDUM812003 TaxID=3041267 RepID=UPI00280E3198|nr:GntR family transcriptional regulator [Pelagicoccus sp. SDUM812003]MDQ8203557.1 GntR family transcriptional regulator [Pelagicoccus sp. SDUM812003]
MLIRIEHHSGVPAYRQLIEQIKRQIALDHLKPGDELPSTRALSAQIGLNPMTISKAYNLLERDGALLRQRGKPLVVAPQLDASPKQTVEDAMKNALRDAAALAHQLGVSQADAVKIFKALLKQNKSHD